MIVRFCHARAKPDVSASLSFDAISISELSIQGQLGPGAQRCGFQCRFSIVFQAFKLSKSNYQRCMIEACVAKFRQKVRRVKRSWNTDREIDENRTRTDDTALSESAKVKEDSGAAHGSGFQLTALVQLTAL